MASAGDDTDAHPAAVPSAAAEHGAHASPQQVPGLGRDTSQSSLGAHFSGYASEGGNPFFLSPERDRHRLSTQSMMSQGELESIEWMGSPASKCAPSLVRQLTDEYDGGGDAPSTQDNWFIVRGLVMFVVLFVFPCVCRLTGITPSARCLLLFLSVLFINLAEVMPLFCTALLVPVLGTLFSVLGDNRSTTETSTLLVKNIFNNTSFMVLGALVINAIFMKCGLDRRFMSWMLRSFALSGTPFLLMLTVGGMFMCSVLYSGSLVLIAALLPSLRESLESKVITPNCCKRILLAVAFCSNAGSCLLPISSPVNLIAVSLLADFDYAISVNTWAAVAVPVAFLTMVVTTGVLLWEFEDAKRDETRGPSMTPDERWEKQQAMLDRLETNHVELTDTHLLFLFIGFLAVLGITVYPTQLEPFIGHPACISLSLVVVVFGSRYMSTEEFCSLEWDLLALVGGINVMAFLVRETGLGVQLSDELSRHPFIEDTSYQILLACMVVTTLSISTFLGHSITGVLLLPLIVAIGIKLKAAETTTIIVAIAVPFGMCTASASMDNAVCYNTSRKLGNAKAALGQVDFQQAGRWTALCASFLLCTLGYRISVYYHGLPGVELPAQKHEDRLKPKEVLENSRHRVPTKADWERLNLSEVGRRPAMLQASSTLQRWGRWATTSSSGGAPRQRRLQAKGAQTQVAAETAAAKIAPHLPTKVMAATQA